VPFLRDHLRAPQTVSAKVLKGRFPLEAQVMFNKKIAEKMGFDFEAGRLDTATHPFTSGTHPHDVRITSRYADDDLLYSIFTTIHEAGHGLYEQGLLSEHFGSPLGEAISLGMHESQSRFWENMVGKSAPFWQYFYPSLRRTFPKPFATLAFNDFYKAINRVEPSLVRTEADEVTYNLHIILRFEIEKAMIEGTLDLRDLPEIWRANMQEYLGVTVPNDRLGVLQDVHWATGAIGYFPTYAFGNLYAAQFYSAMRTDIPDMAARMKKGDLITVREWLRKHIHATGKRYTADRLVQKVTGEPLNSRYFTEYLTEKFSALYGLASGTAKGSGA
jgi:carboxypeptidase Taq